MPEMLDSLTISLYTSKQQYIFTKKANWKTGPLEAQVTHELIDNRLLQLINYVTYEVGMALKSDMGIS